MLEANVQYNDMRGSLALDWEMTGLFELAKAKGIDTEKYFPIALSFWGLPRRQFRIYAIDCGITGAKNFDENAKFAGTLQGTLTTSDDYLRRTSKRDHAERDTGCRTFGMSPFGCAYVAEPENW